MVEGSQVRGSNSLNPLQLLAGRKQEVCAWQVGGGAIALLFSKTSLLVIIWNVLPKETSGTLVAGEGGWTLSERPYSPTMQIFCGHL